MAKYTVPTAEEREIVRKHRPDLDPDDFVVEFRCEGRIVLLEKKKRALLRDVVINFKEVSNGNQ